MRLDDVARAVIQRDGRDPDEVQRQLDLLAGGARFTRVARPCTRGDGIEVLPDPVDPEWLQSWRVAAASGRITAFVPASGAATRMVAAMAKLAQLPEAVDEAELDRLADDPAYAAAVTVLRDPAALALWDPSMAAGEARSTAGRIVEAVAGRPKALLPFHRYPDGSTRTALEEHLDEAAAMEPGAPSVRVHFTLDPSLWDDARAVVAAFAERTGLTMRVDFSAQAPHTDTVALGSGGLARGSDGATLYRPGGHGALIHNLEQLGGDLVLIKNIDNIVVERRRHEVVAWRSRLVARLLAVESEVHAALRALDDGDIARARDHAAHVGIAAPDADGLRRLLYRPIRVCAMVENRGEPGGGPFWVDTRGQQIVEASQIDRSDPGQAGVLARATHFNPVDLACSVRDHRGQPYRLSDYVDPDAVIVTDKVVDGASLRVLERPGLWNGAMAHWITRFVEVPVTLFQPAKTLADLMREGRRG